MKSFGNKTAQPARRIPFEFTVQRDDVPETHTFQALGRLDAASLTRALEAAQRETPDMLSAFTATIRRMLDNTDGIPSKWKPSAMPQLDHEDPRPPSFRVPYGVGKGNILPMTEAANYLSNEVHSSRRRWIELMDGDDDDVIVELNDLVKLFEWLISEATGKASAESS